MIVGAVIDEKGNPVCCEMWPGNTADVKTLIPIADRLLNRFNISQFCLAADRGMISQETMTTLEEKSTPYILGSRMKLVKEIKEKVLSRAGRYQEVYPEISPKDPSPLKVKKVKVNEQRYIVCFNSKQARKDALDRQAIVDKLQKKLKEEPKSFAIRSECQGCSGKVFQAVGVAVPPTIREV